MRIASVQLLVLWLVAPAAAADELGCTITNVYRHSSDGELVADTYLEEHLVKKLFSVNTKTGAIIGTLVANQGSVIPPEIRVGFQGDESFDFAVTSRFGKSVEFLRIRAYSKRLQEMRGGRFNGYPFLFTDGIGHFLSGLCQTLKNPD